MTRAALLLTLALTACCPAPDPPTATSSPSPPTPPAAPTDQPPVTPALVPAATFTDDTTTADGSPYPIDAIRQFKLVASKRSNVYHHPWCRHAKTIAPHNLIRFNHPSKHTAQQANFRSCLACKP